MLLVLQARDRHTVRQIGRQTDTVRITSVCKFVLDPDHFNLRYVQLQHSTFSGNMFERVQHARSCWNHSDGQMIDRHADNYTPTWPDKRQVIAHLQLPVCFTDRAIPNFYVDNSEIFPRNIINHYKQMCKK